MSDQCNIISGALGDLETQQKSLQRQIEIAYATIRDANMAVVAALQAGQDVPQGTLNAISSMQSERDSLQSDLDCVNQEIILLTKMLKDCEEQAAQG